LPKVKKIVDCGKGLCEIVVGGQRQTARQKRNATENTLPNLTMANFKLSGGKRTYTTSAAALRAANRASLKGLDVEIVDGAGNPVLCESDDLDLLAYNDSFGECEDISDLLPRRRLAFD
jgi:hypothetical protein